MLKKSAPDKSRRPMSLEEKLGHAWGIVYLGLIVLIGATILVRAFFFAE